MGLKPLEPQCLRRPWLVDLFFSYDVLLKVVITLMTLSAQKSYNASNLFSSRNHGVYNDINPHPAMIEKGQDLYFNAPLRKKMGTKSEGKEVASTMEEA